MKKFVIAVGLMSIVTSLSFAEAPGAAPTKEGPCKQIMEACEQAGFQKGMHKTDGKGLYKDCMTPMLAGQSVAGVTVDPATLSACQQKRAKHQQKKAGASTPSSAHE